jgi:hypothetical protein
MQTTLFTFRATCRLARSAVGAGLEMQIPQAAIATFGNQGALTIVRQIRQQIAGFFFTHDSANRHSQKDVIGATTIAIGASTAFTVAGTEMSREAVFDQRIDIAVGDHPDAAATSTITAIRAALGNEFLATKRDGAIAAIAGGYVDTNFVNKFHRKPGLSEGINGYKLREENKKALSTDRAF